MHVKTQCNINLIETKCSSILEMYFVFPNNWLPHFKLFTETTSKSMLNVYHFNKLHCSQRLVCSISSSVHFVLPYTYIHPHLKHSPVGSFHIKLITMTSNIIFWRMFVVVMFHKCLYRYRYVAFFFKGCLGCNMERPFYVWEGKGVFCFFYRQIV